MLLSIVMMIKNEEKYLDKTLKALEPLMEDIESELIILDTGSTDNSIEIARRYTDKVYFAQWNNNFAEMRNISIGYAAGEWILILDADEELLDYEELKKFFKTNLHKKYNCASIELKSIYKEDGSDYNLASIYRLFRNKDNFRYEGAIHEQPIYKMPAYKNVALFKHYGYLFANEEVKQVKNKRNLEILLKEIKNEPNNPYVNYQLGKTYMILNQNEDALFYMNKAYEIYKSLSIVPAYIVCDLANLYINKGECEKCERLCIKYIKYDSKNIDIYYYLAISQKQLRKYNDSLRNYERYLYYIDNYNLSTQANDICCTCNTISYAKKSINDIIFIYYKLGLYEEVMNKIKEMEFEELKEVYSIVFVVLCKLNKAYKIVELYNSETDKRRFRRNSEVALNHLKEDEKNILYELLSNIDDNYGILNKLRVGKLRCTEDYKKILEEEIEEYYSEIIYYALKEGISIENMLNNLSYLKIQKFINYLIINKKNCILDLYRYLYKVKNTLDIKKIHIYSCLAKGLLTYGNLFDEKYEMLFFMHITYRYECIKSSYSSELSDEELLEYLNNEDDYFVVKINNINKLYKSNKLEYLRELKRILKENTQYKDGIQLLINRFEEQLKENEELKELKKKYKVIIEEKINSGNLDVAKKLIKDYEEIFKYDDINNMKAVISIYRNEIQDAEKYLKLAYFFNRNDEDLLFNIAYIRESQGDIEEVEYVYKKIISISENDNLINEAKEKLQELNDKYKDILIRYKLDKLMDFNKLIEYNFGKEIKLDQKFEIIKKYKVNNLNDLVIYIALSYVYIIETNHYQINDRYNIFKIILSNIDRNIYMINDVFLKRQSYLFRDVVNNLNQINNIIKGYNDGFKEKAFEELEYIINNRSLFDVNILEKIKLEYFYSKKIDIEIREREEYQKCIKSKINSGMLEEAKNDIDFYERKYSKDEFFYMNKFNIFNKLKNIELAKKVLLECLNEKKFSFEVFYNMALIYDNEGKFELAENYYKKATNLCLSEEQYEFINNKLKNMHPKLFNEEKSKMPKVSVLIPSYNQKKYLKQTIDSVLMQDYENLEVIVSDDCSIDGTHEMLQNYSIKGKIKYIKNEKNLGAGINSLHNFYNYVNGKYVMILNHDDYLISNSYISKAVKIMEKNKNVSMVFANVELLHENGIVLKTNVDLDEVNSGKNYFINYGYCSPHITGVLTTIFRRENAIKMEVLTENTKSKDLFLHLKMMLSGDIGFIKEHVAVYRIHNESISYNMPHEYDFYTIYELEQLKFIAKKLNIYNEESLNRWLFNVMKSYLKWRLKNCTNKNHKEDIIKFLKENYYIVYYELLKEGI